MANELKIYGNTGDAIYCMVWNQSGQVLDLGTGFVSFDQTDFEAGDYAVVCSEIQAGSRLFVASFPAGVDAGTYVVEARRGSAPSTYDVDDTRMGLAQIMWNGDGNGEAQTLLDVDTTRGSLMTMLEVLSAAVCGTTVVTDDQVEFKDGNGDVVLTIVYGGNRGERNSSTIS